jgi:hypothetical protein
LRVVLSGRGGIVVDYVGEISADWQRDLVDFITIGTDHNLQKSDSGLRDILRSVLQNNPVVLIAEEVETKTPVNTFGRELIGKDRWLSVDMEEQERKDAGIYNTLLHTGSPVRHPSTGRDVSGNEYHLISEGKRENHWLNKIEQWCKKNGITDGTIVLVCGHNHLPFVGAKISARGHSVVQLEYVPYDKEKEQGLFTIFND